MSADNGGRGTPPVPPEGHGPPEPQGIPVTKEITMQSQALTVARNDEGGGEIGFIVLEGMQGVMYRFHFGEPGKQRILEELAGGLKLP